MCGEERTGRTGLIYIVSGVGASLFSAVFIAGMISVGASGALFGLYGAIVSDVIVNWWVDAPLFGFITAICFSPSLFCCRSDSAENHTLPTWTSRRSLMDKPLTILIVLLVNAAINLAIGLLPFVDNFAHVSSRRL